MNTGASSYELQGERDAIEGTNEGGFVHARALRAPFPYFGGKSRVADVVWRAFGNLPNYVEPFAGSLAVLLSRPHEPKIETVNDWDAMLCNFWRSVAAAPDDVASYCDWPVNEIDLHARHAWLMERLPEHRDRMRADPDFFDAKIAGWWVWGLSMWIGSGWCHESKLERNAMGMPAINGRCAGSGVHRKSTCRGQAAVNSTDLTGVARGERTPSLGNMRGVLGTREGRWADGAPRSSVDDPPCLEWFRALQRRLRRVRVCCGDWTRVLTDSVLGTTKSRNSGMNPCAVFLDPPYPDEERSRGLYSVDDGSIADRVAAWAMDRGGDKDLRIAFCGYEDAHTFPGSWSKHQWTGRRGYAGDDNANRERECIWFSPHCLPLEQAQRGLFDEGMVGP